MDLFTGQAPSSRTHRCLGSVGHLGQRLVLTFSGDPSMSGTRSREWPPDTHSTSDPTLSISLAPAGCPTS